ncbi:hypothetical protein niasHS_017083 [Heterodera schachtii]|uniref:Uncharacterized protein n=1 Tax=Heterodera schachtii TaxID=97005 RepID=A0ABD2I328_HETSC
MKRTLRWAIGQCKQKGMDCSAKNYRQMLGQALVKIQFPIINKDFLADIALSGVLSSDELVSLLLIIFYQEFSLQRWSLPYPSFIPSSFPTIDGQEVLGFSEFMAFEMLTELKRRIA